MVLLDRKRASDNVIWVSRPIGKSLLTHCLHFSSLTYQLLKWLSLMPVWYDTFSAQTFKKLVKLSNW